MTEPTLPMSPAQQGMYFDSPLTITSRLSCAQSIFPVHV